MYSLGPLVTACTTWLAASWSAQWDASALRFNLSDLSKGSLPFLRSRSSRCRLSRLLSWLSNAIKQIPWTFLMELEVLVVYLAASTRILSSWMGIRFGLMIGSSTASKSSFSCCSQRLTVSFGMLMFPFSLTVTACKLFDWSASLAYFGVVIPSIPRRVIPSYSNGFLSPFRSMLRQSLLAW